MAGSTHERILAAEWLVVMGTETLDALSQITDGQTFALPTPSVYFATMVVYLMLAAVAMFGERPGRLAAAFGGVAGLAILLAPTAKGKRSPVVGALGYFDQLLKSGPNIPPSAAASGPSPSAAGSGKGGSSAPLTGAANAAASAGDAITGGLAGIWSWLSGELSNVSSDLSKPSTASVPAPGRSGLS